jgi:dihydrofolate synthase / folylpolyglutamate synthase
MVMNQIKKEKYNQLHIVLGVVNDKDLEEILPLFPKNAIYYFCKPNIPRGLNAEIFNKKQMNTNLIGKVHNSVSNAYQSRIEKSKKKT